MVKKKTDIERMGDEDRMNLEAGWYCRRHSNDEEPEYVKELEKKDNPIKKYEEEVIRENVRKNLQKGMLSEKEEEEMKEKFENPEVRSVYDILSGMLSFLFPYEPGENIDKSRKISESDMINVAANLIPRMREVRKNMFYDKHKLPENKAEDVERLARDLSGCKEVGVKKEYITPKCEIVGEGVIPGDFDGICRDLMALHARKNKDYGNAAHESYKEFGLNSYVIRLNDKMSRLKSLTKPGAEQEVKSESIEDTLMDLAAYAIMAIESLRS